MVGMCDGPCDGRASDVLHNGLCRLGDVGWAHGILGKTFLGFRPLLAEGQGVPAATPRPKPAWHMVRRLKGLYLWVLTAGE